MEHVYLKQYVIMKISEDGLMKHPKDTWGDSHTFYAYDSEQEAIDAINRASEQDRIFGDLVIVTYMRSVWREDGDEV